MFDIIQIVFWCITYIFILVGNLKNKTTSMGTIPFFPTILNLSWEVNALIVSKGFWGHIVWLFLDLGVMASCMYLMKEKRKKIQYIISILIGVVVFNIIFRLNMMLISSFVINAIMSVSFLLQRTKLLQKHKVLIATTKGMGTLFATLHYAKFSLFSAVLGILIAIVDMIYLFFCLKEKRHINVD